MNVGAFGGLFATVIDSQAAPLQQYGVLAAVFVAGCILGQFVSKSDLLKQKSRQVPKGDALDALDPMLKEHQYVTDNFPGTLVQLKRGESGWCFHQISKTRVPENSCWKTLDASAGPVPLVDVLEDSEAGVLSDVLDTAVELHLPVNYECKMKTGSSEQLWVALILSEGIHEDSGTLNGIVLSIMDRRILEQELDEEKLFAEQVLEHSGVIFSVRDKEAKLIRTNKAFVEIGGYTPEEIYFSEGDRRLIGESYDFVLGQFRKVLKGDYPLIAENNWYCKDGSKRVLRWTNTGLRNSEGIVNYIISVGVDITDLRLLEDQLKDKVHEFGALFDNSLVGIALVRHQRIVKANQICAGILGYQQNEIQDLDMAKLFPDTRVYQQFLEEMNPRILLGLRHFDYSFRKKDGKLGEFRISASPINTASIEDGIILVLDDISEIKMVERALLRSETRFRTIFDKMASGLALINENGYFEEVNDSWCRITGYTREEARRLSVLDITHQQDLQLSSSAMNRFINDTSDMERMEKRYIRKDGTLLWVDLTASKMKAEGTADEITLVSIINDITDRKAIEAQLKEMNDRLSVEKSRAQVLADHRMAVIELFDTFRKSQSIEDLQGILKNTLPQFVKYRDLMIALRISRTNPGYVIKDLLGETSEDVVASMLKDGRGIIGSVIRSKQIYVSNDVLNDETFIPHHPDVRSYLALPIVYKDFLWGVIGLDHFQKDHFNEQDIQILTMVGTLIAMQMEEMTAKSALQQEASRLRALHELVQEMAQARDNLEIIKHICAGELYPAVHIYTVAPSGELQPCLCSDCQAAGKPVPEVITRMDPDQCIQWEAEGEKLRFNHGQPIIYGGELLGVLQICSELPFSSQEIELASILTEQTAVFWELNKLIAHRELEAMVDPLTGVWNRRYMIARLEQEDGRLKRYGGTACVTIMDLGDFKWINDHYGHVKGDEVLTAAAQLIENSIRKTDFVGRYGGDEFILFLPNTDEIEAEAICSKIRDGIKAMEVEGVHREVEIDYGVAVVPGDDTSLMGAIRAADERMYMNKRRRKRDTSALS